MSKLHADKKTIVRYSLFRRINKQSGGAVSCLLLNLNSCCRPVRTGIDRAKTDRTVRAGGARLHVPGWDVGTGGGAKLPLERRGNGIVHSVKS